MGKVQQSMILDDWVSEKTGPLSASAVIAIRAWHARKIRELERDQVEMLETIRFHMGLDDVVDVHESGGSGSAVDAGPVRGGEDRE